MWQVVSKSNRKAQAYALHMTVQQDFSSCLRTFGR